jgi:hypothetical protein
MVSTEKIEKKCEERMKAKRFVGLVAVAMLSVAPMAIYAQAFAVGADGKMQQEKQAQMVPAENQPSADQLSKLFEVMRIKQQMASMRTMVPGMVQQQIQTAMRQTEEGLPTGTKLTPEQREKMQGIMTKYVGKAMDLYPADEMLTDMTAIYQRHLSKDDVEGLIAFYGSPAGQHLLDAQPVIAQEYMPVVMQKVAQRSQTMTKEMMKEMAEVVPTKAAATPAKTGTTKTPAK